MHLFPFIQVVFPEFSKVFPEMSAQYLSAVSMVLTAYKTSECSFIHLTLLTKKEIICLGHTCIRSSQWLPLYFSRILLCVWYSTSMTITVTYFMLTLVVRQLLTVARVPIYFCDCFIWFFYVHKILLNIIYVNITYKSHYEIFSSEIHFFLKISCMLENGDELLFFYFTFDESQI